ncbi:MAG: DNA repair protein RecN [Anaerolineae bacterium]
MLIELSISNFAIIDQLHLRFAPGFNVLTGETGAGKSIIIDAVSLVLGERADSTMIRAGADQARVEGIFVLGATQQEAIVPLLREYGLEDGGEELILAREINRSGRHVCRVNGRAVPLKILQRVGEGLVDIHGQGEHLSLLRVREHVDFLDHYGGLGELRGQVVATVKALRQVRQELADLRRDERELARRMDLLEYQVNEIAAAKLRPGEEEELNQERTLLANAERLISLADEAYRALYDGREAQKSALDLLGEVAHSLTSLETLDARLGEPRRVAEELSYQVEDLARTLRDYRDRIEYDPARLRQVEERLDLIYNLKRKYGDSIEEILAFGERAARELATITHSEERIAELEEQEQALLGQLSGLAEELSQARRQVSERLAAAIEGELAELGMDRARFQVAMEWVEAEDGVEIGGRRYAFDSTGVDRVEFLISPNPGEPLRPLAKIASGGETSRLMLAMKSILSAADRIPTLIFDEIDAGIGGRAGAVVGRKLWGLSPEHQVLCVTHLPQLACFADAHYQVSKEEVGGRTVTRARPVVGEERIEELTLMLGSRSEVTRQKVLEMLEQTRQWKEARGQIAD